MNKIIFSLFLFPMLCQAQGVVNLTVIDWITQKPIHYYWGDNSISPPNQFIEEFSMSGDIKTSFNQKLAFAYPNYQFDTTYITGHNYRLSNDSLYVVVEAYPATTEVYSIEIANAKSKQIKNDSVWIELYSDYDLEEITLYANKKKKEICSLTRIKQGKVSYFKTKEKLDFNKLEDGYFLVDGQQVPFSKKDWMQPIFIRKDKKESTQNEAKLVAEHFRMIAINDAQKRAYRNELDDLSRRIEYLEWEIDTLKNGPTSSPPPPPPPPLPFSELFYFKYENPVPTQGMPAFLDLLKKAITTSDLVTYIGNISFEVIVATNGDTAFRLIHAAKEQEKIYALIEATVHRESWRSSRFRGNPYAQKILISIDLLKAP
jgi:hypothetical protein